MPFALHISLAVAAFAGHTALFVWLFNRLHAIAWPCKWIKRTEKVLMLYAVLFPLLYAGRWLWSGEAPVQSLGAWSVYPVGCLLAAALAVPLWLWPKLRARPARALLSNHTQVHDIERSLGRRPTGTRSTAYWAAIPGNEIFRLQIQHKELRLPRLDRRLDGFTIAHLTDLHLTGQLTAEFYDEVVTQTLAQGADLIALTGDLVEKTACLPWVKPIFGRLQAKQGVYYVLGNHETRLPDPGELRRELDSAGLIPLAGRVLKLPLAGGALQLGGDELPWFGTAPNWEGAPEAGVLRVLLAHTPDRFFAAQRDGVDLMLAGHNHGGQIRLPLIGPLITPSWHGSLFAAGVFEAGNTVMHVSRGIAGVHPIRLNCPPELAVLTLRCG